MKIMPLCIGAAVLLVWLAWEIFLARRTKFWPLTETTIQSGDREVVTSTDGGNPTLPVFAFTYKVEGDCYSGRFCLQPYIADPPKDLRERLVNTKLPVKYNPRKPAKWYIPVDLIEGSKVKQKLGPHLTHLYPR